MLLRTELLVEIKAKVNDNDRRRIAEEAKMFRDLAEISGLGRLLRATVTDESTGEKIHTYVAPDPGPVVDGTKLSPGMFDCYANAKLDEPLFILLGRDPVASQVVRYWAALRVRCEENSRLDAQVDDAIKRAFAMETYARGLGKGDRCRRAFFKDREFAINSVLDGQQP